MITVKGNKGKLGLGSNIQIARILPGADQLAC